MPLVNLELLAAPLVEGEEDVEGSGQDLLALVAPSGKSSTGNLNTHGLSSGKSSTGNLNMQVLSSELFLFTDWGPTKGRTWRPGQKLYAPLTLIPKLGKTNLFFWGGGGSCGVLTGMELELQM